MLLALILWSIFFVGLYFVLHREDKAKQTTWVYCPGCNRELTTARNVIITDEDVVRYYCGDCLTVSVWDFDMPVPLLLDSFYRDPNDWMKR